MTLRLYTLILCTAIGLSGLSAHAQGQRPAAARRPPARLGRSVSRTEVPQHRPRDDGRTHRRPRGARVESGGLLRRHRDRRAVEDDQQRHDLGSAVRRSRRHRVDRRHRDQSRTTPTPCGSAAARTTTARAARGATASTSRPTAARRWKHMGLGDVEAHRAHHRRSDRSRRGLRRGARQPVGPRRRARRLQDDRRRPDLDARALRRRRHRRDRAGDGSRRTTRCSTRRPISAAAPPGASTAAVPAARCGSRATPAAPGRS